MRALSIILLPLLFLACSGNKETTSEQSKSPIPDTVITINDSVSVSTVSTRHPDKGKPAPFLDSLDEGGNGYQNFIHPATFSESTRIYADHDTTSRIIQIVGFNTPFKILSEDIPSWLIVECNNQTGFIKRSADIVWHTFTKKNGDKHLKYFVKGFAQPKVVDKKDPDAPVYWAAVYKYDLVKEIFIDTFNIEYVSIIKEIDSRNWKNVDLILYTGYIGACCGCTSRQKYIIDANNKFDILFETSRVNSDGEDEYESGVYLPLNPQIDTIQYGVHERNYVFNTNGEPILNGNIYKMEQRVLNKYYTWDGFKLKFINESKKVTPIYVEAIQ